MQPREQRQTRIRPNNGQRRQIELMCEENRAGVLVTDTIYIYVGVHAHQTYTDLQYNTLRQHMLGEANTSLDHIHC